MENVISEGQDASMRRGLRGHDAKLVKSQKGSYPSCSGGLSIHESMADGSKGQTVRKGKWFHSFDIERGRAYTGSGVIGA